MVAKSMDIGTHALLPYEAHNRQLLLEWSPLHLHVLLFNNNTASVEALESFSGSIDDEDEWDALLGQSKLLQLHDVAVKLVAAAPRFLPCPLEVLDTDRCKQELDLLLGAALWQHTSSDILQHRDMAVIWQMPEMLLQRMRNHFQVMQVQHVQAMLLQRPVATGTIGQLLLAPQQCMLQLQQDGRFVFAACLPVLNADDLAYRLLHVCQQYGLDAADVQWQCSGMITTDADLYTGLQKYLQQFQLPSTDVSMPAEATPHYFAHLLAVLS